MTSNLVRKIILPFLCGILILPSFIFLHEGGHWLAARTLGLQATLHFRETQVSGRADSSLAVKNEMVSLAGPLVNFVLMLCGLFWLKTLRRKNASEPPGIWDWVATSLALNAGRGLRGVFSLPTNSQPSDEARLSQMIHCPGWLSLCILGLAAIIVIVLIIRLHPRGSRLVPFTAIFAGRAMGSWLWMNAVGPALLP